MGHNVSFSPSERCSGSGVSDGSGSADPKILIPDPNIPSKQGQLSEKPLLQNIESYRM